MIFSQSICEVHVESYHLNKNITDDPKQVIEDTVSAFKKQFPAAKHLHVKFTGVNDRTLAADGQEIRDKEKFAKNNWKKSGIGTFIKDQDMFIVNLETWTS